MKTISIVAPVYNEKDNLREFVERVESVLAAFVERGFDYEIVFTDNASTDGTQEVLRALCLTKPRCRAVLNRANYGHLRNQFQAIINGRGDAVIQLSADLQDPPELIPLMLQEWMEGAEVVLLQKESSEESRAMFALRGLYYFLIRCLAEHPHAKQTTGAGLYDRSVVNVMASHGGPNPYLRGLPWTLGFQPRLIPFRQPLRRKGRSKNDFWTLYDLAVLGMTSSTRWPLRLPVFLGLALQPLALVFVLWNGWAAFFASVAGGVFFFLGLLGEYVAALLTELRNYPRTLERERWNFQEASVPAPNSTHAEILPDSDIVDRPR